MKEIITNNQSDMAPDAPAKVVQGDVALLAKFFDATELSGSEHAELVALAGAMAKYFEPVGTLSATDVLEAVAARWWIKGKF